MRYYRLLESLYVQQYDAIANAVRSKKWLGTEQKSNCWFVHRITKAYTAGNALFLSCVTLTYRFVCVLVYLRNEWITFFCKKLKQCQY